MLISTTNDETNYAWLFDPGPGKLFYKGYGKQRAGNLYSPDISKWKRKDCPLCHEPFAVVKRISKDSLSKIWYCTNCHRDITSEMKIIA